MPGPPVEHARFGEPKSGSSLGLLRRLGSAESKTLTVPSTPSSVALTLNPHAERSSSCCLGSLSATPTLNDEKSQVTWGHFDGAEVGSISAIGLLVGNAVGANVGPVLGDEVGWTVGLPAGLELGEFDGFSVGFGVGAAEGSDLGEREGL